MSNFLSISAFIEEIQLQGQILLSFFHQPHELKIWKDLLYNQEENLRNRKWSAASWLQSHAAPHKAVLLGLFYLTYRQKSPIYAPSACRVPALSQHNTWCHATQILSCLSTQAHLAVKRQPRHHTEPSCLLPRRERAKPWSKDHLARPHQRHSPGATLFWVLSSLSHCLASLR